MEPTVIYSLCTFSLITLIYVSIVFLVSQVRSDNSIMDIAYGPAFAVGTWGTIVLTGSYSTPAIMAGALVSLWALRLGVRIARKNWGKPEDPRYAAWRTAWLKEGAVYFIIRSFIQINLLQGIIIVAVASPLILLITSTATFSYLLYVGAAIMLAGLAYESIADWQLDAFLSRKRQGTEPAVLMTTGLFRFSRRPNYFGETLVWWGFAVMALPLSYGIVALISPLLITYIVTKITGPMLENIFLQKYPVEYRAYIATTNYFIPGRSRQNQNLPTA